MRSAIASIAALLISVFVLLLGNGLQNTLLPIRANAAGFGDLTLGLMGSAYFLGMTAGCLLSPALIRRAGHIRAFAACTAIATIVPLLHGLFHDAGIWIVLRAVNGMLFAALYAIIESWLNDKATNEQRGGLLSIYMIMNFGGTAVGQQGMLIPDENGFILFCIAAIMISLSAVPVSMTRSISPPTPETPHIRPMWLYHLSPVAFVTCIAVGLVNSGFWALGPVFAAKLGYSSTHVANFMSLVVIGTILAMWPIGRLSDRMDRRITLLGIVILSVSAGLALAFGGPHSLIWLYGAGLIYGATTMPVYSVAISHANDHAKPGEAVEVATGVLLLYCFGAMVGPMLAAGAMQLFGPSGMFFYGAAVHVILIAVIVMRMLRQEPPKAADREAYVPIRPTTTVVVGLDPRVPSLEDDDTEE